MTAVRQQARGALTGLPRLLPAPDGPVPYSSVAAGTVPGGSVPGGSAVRRGPAYRDHPGALIGDIEAAGLTGRGGAAFPVHRKLRAVLDAATRRRRPAVVIANGAESEPASDKDATLLWLSPDLVLDGVQLAAEAVGADRAILVVHASRGHDVGARLRAAVAARQAEGTDRVRVELAQAPARFLSGQETALVSQLADGPGIPLFVPPRITERGLGGAPTLVQNVESLAHLALIARNGADWFRSVGPRAEPGSMLATVRRADGQPRVTEIPLGFPLKALAAGLSPDEAVLVGGYHGSWLSGAEALELTMDNRSLAGAGARLGAGVVAVLPAGRCGLVETASVARYLALESAGQCGPCLNGLPRMAAALAEIAGGRARPGVAEDLARWSGLVTGRGACHHPDGTARFVGSALRTFAAELGRHQRGRCSATDTRPFLPLPRAAGRTSQDGS
jgi:NADH:ubiquinone oxidoreductase subunit F (NADH-binding)